MFEKGANFNTHEDSKEKEIEGKDQNYSTENISLESDATVFEVEGINDKQAQEKSCANILASYTNKIPEYQEGDLFKISAARIIITDLCPYSCTYCGVHYQKMLEEGKISQEDFDRRDIGANEGGSIRNYRETKDSYLSPDDYKFLVAVLRHYFKTMDITLTGGDPFTRPEVKEIIGEIASLGVKVTTLTKGLPLFSKDGQENISQKAGDAPRIIFSLDTLNEDKHISQNLPLADKDVATGALAKTLETIKQACELGYHVDINSVVEPVDYNNEKQAKISFINTKSLVDFALETKIRKIKFLELETKNTLGNPYLEDYFNRMKAGGYFASYEISKWISPYVDSERPAIEFCIIKRKDDANDGLKLYTYRAHCSATALKKDGNRNCDLTGLGELNINSTGEVVACQKRPYSNKFDLSPAIHQRDISGIINCIMAASLEIREQTCPEERKN